MMKYYDFKKVYKFIETNKKDISTVDIGMDEDWFWTGNTVFEDGEYKINLRAKGLKVGGINGSSWATPVMRVEYKDGSEKTFDCRKRGEAMINLIIGGLVIFMMVFTIAILRGGKR